MALTYAQLEARVAEIRATTLRNTPLYLAYLLLCDRAQTAISEYRRDALEGERQVNEVLTNQCMELENTVERLERRIWQLEKAGEQG